MRKGKTGTLPKGVGNNGKPIVAVISSHTQSLFWFRMNMMEDFIAAGYDVIAVGQEPADAWREKFSARGIQYFQLYVQRNGANPFCDLVTLTQLYRFLRRVRPSRVFCYQAKTVIYTCLAARLLQLPQIYSLIAGVGSVFHGRSRLGKLVKKIMVTEYKVALKGCRRVIFQNSDDLDEFVKAGIVTREKCRMIHGSGVDLERFCPMPQPDQAVFILIARLIKDKGIMEYLEACREFKRLHSQARCMLVGPYDTNPSALRKEELQKYIEDGSVEYFGEQEDVRPFLAQASVFVLPSYHEGTPKTVLESMACARAVITTDAPGCRETVADGVNGFLVPIGNASAVVEKMELLFRKPELVKKMGEEGRKLAEEKYDVKKVNRSIMDIMEMKLP